MAVFNAEAKRYHQIVIDIADILKYIVQQNNLNYIRCNTLCFLPFKASFKCTARVQFKPFTMNQRQYNVS
jgi:hypothetical protein